MMILKKDKKYHVIFLLLGIVMSGFFSLSHATSNVQAKENFTTENEPIPSITIKKQVTDTSIKDGEQHLLPKAGVSFFIQKVTLQATSKEKINLQDKRTYTIIKDEQTPISFTLLTDDKGIARISGKEQLPNGTYQVIEEGIKQTKESLFSLPYLDEKGKENYHITLYPKSGLEDSTTTKRDEPLTPYSSGPLRQENRGTGNNGDSSLHHLPNTKQSVQTLMQTSGELMKLPWVKILVIGVGMFFLLGGIVVVKQTKEEKTIKE